MKYRSVLAIVLLVLIADQALKFYIKTHYPLNHQTALAGKWAYLYFIENKGMAFGYELGGTWGKLALTFFRLIACIWGFYFIKTKMVAKQLHGGLIFCAALILAGALGNLIDSTIYGMIFTESNGFTAAKLVPWGHGYGKLFQGRVVDMLYFPVIETSYPSWMGSRYACQPFIFFSPIFNIADAAISIGVISILVFQKWILPQEKAQGNALHEESVAAEIEEAV